MGIRSGKRNTLGPEKCCAKYDSHGHIYYLGQQGVNERLRERRPNNKYHITVDCCFYRQRTKRCEILYIHFVWSGWDALQSVREPMPMMKQNVSNCKWVYNIYIYKYGVVSINLDRLGEKWVEFRPNGVLMCHQTIFEFYRNRLNAHFTVSITVEGNAFCVHPTDRVVLCAKWVSSALSMNGSLNVYSPMRPLNHNFERKHYGNRWAYEQERDRVGTVFNV